MRILFVLVCSLALVFAASGAQEKKKEEKKPAPKKQAQTVQGAGPRGGVPKGGGPHQQTHQKTNVSPHAATLQGGSGVGKGKGKGKGSQQVNTAATGGQPVAGKAGRAQKIGAQKIKGGPANVTQAKSKPFKPQHFKLPTKTTPTKVTAVNFQQGRRIAGSQNWQGSNYQVFRNYKSEWHDQGWWKSHYNNRVVFVYGGWYAWNAGYWIPAWGYAPNAYYAYDGPIYGYNNLPPDQVIANVQTALQQQGYYQGQVDGLLGPQTRAAITDYQRANGLAETASVDQPTLQSLGMA
jgi:hypothetical protein